MQTQIRLTQNPANPLAGKIAIVTGGARGLGEATSRLLCQSAMKVVIADVRLSLAQDVAQQITDEGGEAIAQELDVREPDSVNALFESTLEHYGKVDVLVNNAGTDQTLSIEELSLEDWQRVINVNLNGPFYTSKAVFGHMREQGGGYIINIISTAAMRAWPNASAYHASKWGLLGFTRALHVEGRPHNIKVTGLVAGGMRTPFLLDRFPDIDVTTLQEPANVAQTIRYLLMQPEGTVISEMMVLPMKETSWP
ncbi:MAG: SDR family oxidoreductase [Elainellaceae cyanobacterium]